MVKKALGRAVFHFLNMSDQKANEAVGRAISSQLRVA
ncbi:hypothetical protein SLEP1_g57462 [Rubroshorea leprosula]|uniref:Uncharacterized protein n=1 Tax=Rubroshorea leprosula TaxID=152421 RepID=A0AAV5MQB6_9ROSI|nr:hypothetical protein SLEP1_g57462 [Rubroshorea leprosula]